MNNISRSSEYPLLKNRYDKKPIFLFSISVHAPKPSFPSHRIEHEIQLSFDFWPKWFYNKKEKQKVKNVESS